MQMITVSAEAMESMKRMVEKLDADNKMLLEALKSSHTAMREASGVSMPAAREVAEAIGIARAAIQQVTKHPPVFETMEI